MTFTVTADESGLRLDAWLVRRDLAGSAAAARRLLLDSDARIEGRPARKGTRVETGQTVALAARVMNGAPLLALPLPALVVLHVDDALVALDKPAGVPCHPLQAGEGGTLADALQAAFPECAQVGGDPREAGLVHRLDWGTSGVIIAARTPSVHAALRSAMSSGASDKHYLAEVVGRPAGTRPGVEAPLVIDVPIGRRGRSGAKVSLAGGRSVLPARTEVWLRAQGPDTSLVEAHLQSGRTHQIRAHLAHVGSPLVADELYGDAAAKQLALALGIETFRLHAWRIRFVHPTTGRTLWLEAPKPAWMSAWTTWRPPPSGGE